MKKKQYTMPRIRVKTIVLNSLLAASGPVIKTGTGYANDDNALSKSNTFYNNDMLADEDDGAARWDSFTSTASR